MRAYFNDENCRSVDASTAYTRGAAIERGDTVYVHLCNGEIVKVQPATSIRLTGDSLEVLNDEAVVATFPRWNVFFASDEEIEPPPTA